MLHSSNPAPRGLLATQALNARVWNDDVWDEDNSEAQASEVDYGADDLLAWAGNILAVSDLGIPPITEDDAALKYRIVELVTFNEGIDSEGVAEKLGISYKIASDLVAELCADGILAPK